MIGGKWYKMLWGMQFGFGVRTGPSSPNGSMPNVPSNDPGCPTGCLFDIVAVRFLLKPLLRHDYAACLRLFHL
jgi:hypothetical protein